MISSGLVYGPAAKGVNDGAGSQGMRGEVSVREDELLRKCCPNRAGGFTNHGETLNDEMGHVLQHHWQVPFAPEVALRQEIGANSVRAPPTRGK